MRLVNGHDATASENWVLISIGFWSSTALQKAWEHGAPFPVTLNPHLFMLLPDVAPTWVFPSCPSVWEEGRAQYEGQGHWNSKVWTLVPTQPV